MHDVNVAANKLMDKKHHLRQELDEAMRDAIVAGEVMMSPGTPNAGRAYERYMKGEGLRSLDAVHHKLPDDRAEDGKMHPVVTIVQ